MQFNFTQNKYSATNYNSNLNQNYNRAPDSTSPSFLTLLEKPKIYTGFIHGYRQPVARIKIQISSFSLLHLQALEQAFQDYFSIYSNELISIQTERDLVNCLGQGIYLIQKAADLPIFETIQIDSISKEENIFNLWIPILHEDCFNQAMAFMLQFMLHHIASIPTQTKQVLQHEMHELINKLKMFTLNMNTRKFLEAAFNENIPFIQLPQNIFQFGYGRYSLWLESSFTDTTSLLGTRLARDKLSTSLILQKAGLPIPDQTIVMNETEAVIAARKIGYPVVIKPHNQDSGDGVFARLTTDNQVRMAFASARKYSDIILIEKHIVGKDYRLLVFNGELIWVIERIPAGVTGDGVSTISELIQKTNQQPERGRDKPLKPIEVSEDTHVFLAEQGVDFNTILNKDYFLPVCRIANVSNGGTPVAAFENVHPDNKMLAETAANLLRLNFAGIDFICPDIQQSYLNTGGCILEINAQPQIGTITSSHLYKNILNKILPNQGRIPIFVVCSSSSDDLFIFKLHSLLKQRYQNIGIVQDDYFYINSDKINRTTSLFTATQSLLFNNTVDVLIVCIHDLDAIEKDGLPFDSYDYLFFLEGHKHHSELYLIDTLFKACHGTRFINEKALDDFYELDISHETNVILTKDKMLEKIYS